jgi:hypothetical protein
VYRTVEILAALVVTLPVGTNLALLYVLFSLVSGRLLVHRGALVPALADTGLGPAMVLRGWRVLGHGRWQCATLIAAFQRKVEEEGLWQPYSCAGFEPVACDTTAFFRPSLRGCDTAHFHADAKRTMAALPFGLAVRVGFVNDRRIPVPMAIVRPARKEQAAPSAETSTAPSAETGAETSAETSAGKSDKTSDETALMQRTLQEVKAQLRPNQVVIGDRGFGVALMQKSGVPHWLVRCARNAVAYDATPPAYSGRGRPPVHGARVRPLARRYKGNLLEAKPPTHETQWDDVRGRYRACNWENLTSKGAPAAAAPFRMVAIHDPAYKEPLLLATTLPARVPPQALCELYRQRWPVEMVPQTAKQMLGAERQFVFGQESRWRLPELILLAGCVMLYLAATLPAVATGFWDRTPIRTAGRLRRVLTREPFPHTWPFADIIRKKNAVTAHLAKGVDAHRRKPSALKRPNQAPKRRSKTKVTRN